MLPSRRGRPARVPAALALLLATAATGVLAACGDTGGLESAGATPAAHHPARLWPGLTPASSPAYDIGEVEHAPMKGVAVPGGDIRRADPVAAVRAEIAAHPDDYAGAGARYHETSARMADCGADGAGDEPGGCPVLRPYYRDLTGDGRPEMTLGFRLLPDRLTAVRVYTVEKDRLVRIMSYEDAVSAVELAGRTVIVRSPSEVAGYEYRLQWTWDADQRAMLLTSDEMLRTDDGGRHARRPSASPSPSVSRSAAPPSSPPAAPSASPSASAR
ncbi:MULTISPECIES: lipoprotein [Streptomyces]|uniref:Lipoprotein n=2 Tax=Streptomyces TaxID=1883 RepID=Q9XAF4_STRCO|nr:MULTISPECIES: lipoprotein [Streptomyces]MYU44827.1 lipoprotein [Streptomyces sp. SID7813]WOY98137.1 lipoprotein [Streptomyces violaceoruber]MDX2930496.1 lipoprotein [Streptomyces sp. NRRL_B-16638]MDX3403861.1 lipoprotein [Streptomyces sp. ME01-18h]MDX3407876.1 lipoprotein [Streptomyces sp. ME02-6977A]